MKKKNKTTQIIITITAIIIPIVIIRYIEEETKIKCIGEKMEQKNNENTDITINWASKENKYLNNILIKWPKIWVYILKNYTHTI